MAWTSMKAWSGSEVLTSADQNTYVGSNIQYVYDNKPEANNWINAGTNVTQLNQRIESGTMPIAFSTSAQDYGTVTFNTAYGTAPRIVLSCTNSKAIAYLLSSGTAWFGVGVRTRDDGTQTVTNIIDWMAIGA